MLVARVAHVARVAWVGRVVCPSTVSSADHAPEDMGARVAVEKRVLQRVEDQSNFLLRDLESSHATDFRSPRAAVTY